VCFWKGTEPNKTKTFTLAGLQIDHYFAAEDGPKLGTEREEVSFCELSGEIVYENVRGRFDRSGMRSWAEGGPGTF
jgi:hypothetical protein